MRQGLTFSARNLVLRSAERRKTHPYDKRLSIRLYFAVNIAKIRECDSGRGQVTRADGEALRKRISAAAYVECSALTQNGLAGVFDTVIDVHLRPEAYAAKPQASCCVIS